MLQSLCTVWTTKVEGGKGVEGGEGEGEGERDGRAENVSGLTIARMMLPPPLLFFPCCMCSKLIQLLLGE